LSHARAPPGDVARADKKAIACILVGCRVMAGIMN
jgi:hypothetical protein